MYTYFFFLVGKTYHILSCCNNKKKKYQVGILCYINYIIINAKRILIIYVQADIRSTLNKYDIRVMIINFNSILLYDTIM